MVSLVEELNEGDLELEDIDLQEVDRVLDEKDKILNGEIEEEHSEVNTLVRPCDTDGPGKIEKSAKQDMMALTNTLVRKLKLRWEIYNPGANAILSAKPFMTLSLLSALLLFFYFFWFSELSELEGGG